MLQKNLNVSDNMKKSEEFPFEKQVIVDRKQLSILSDMRICKFCGGMKGNHAPKCQRVKK
jgi:hypothetical protein